MIAREIINSVIAEKTAGFSNNQDYFSSSRDIFNARLQVYVAETEKWLESAVIGEIGNNTFDHNFQFLPDTPRGVYFNPMYKDSYVVLSDYGMGLTNSLRKVRPQLVSDLESIKLAFLERVSGRYPEQRGNGLKFVLESVRQNNWILYFRSGSGVCNADGTNVFFSEESTIVPGCLAILQFSGGER